jgi:hypothetical protein
LPNIEPEITLEDNSTLGELAAKIKKTETARQLIVKPDFVQQFSEIALAYNQLQLTSFNYAHTFNNYTDFSKVKVQLYAIEALQPNIAKDTTNLYFSIHNKKNLKFRNSLGISYAIFADNNVSYFVNQQNVIQKSESDNFTPLISTFIHFYPLNSSSFKLGGTVGFGVQLNQEKKDINYLLGLSSVLGKNEPLIISVGLAGSKQKRLTNGFKIGDTVSNSSITLPTSDYFKIGFFLSVSFNLNELKNLKN